MLSDIERKVMRIIMNNYRLKGRIPPISELQFRTGRTKDGIYAVLKTLNEQQLIKWDLSDPEQIEVNYYTCVQRGF